MILWSKMEFFILKFPKISNNDFLKRRMTKCKNILKSTWVSVQTCKVRFISFLDFSLRFVKE